MKRMVTHSAAVALFSLVSAGSAIGEDRSLPVAQTGAGEKPIEHRTFWISASELMPGWGLYPNGEAYGGTKPLGKFAAWRGGHLTWIPEFPADGTYQVYVRRYSGYGNTQVSIDEKAPVKGRGWAEPAGAPGRYLWEHLGQAPLKKGRHHVDLQVAGMLDAILFTTNAKFNPAKGRLPEPEKSPLVRAPRRYRDDAHLASAAGTPGLVAGIAPPYEEMLNDFVPAKEQLVDRVKLWGAAGQYVNGSFVVRALHETGPLTATLKQLVGPGETRIGAERIDFRVVHLRSRILVLFEATIRKVLLPDLLLRDDHTALPPKGKQGGFGGGICATAIPAHESRQFWLTIEVPKDARPGLYRCTIDLEVQGNAKKTLSLPVELEILPLELKPVEGYYSIYHRSHPIDPKVAKLDGNYVNPTRYLAELKDQVRHGVNAATLYGGAATLKEAKEAGMTEAPCLMTWNTDAKNVAEAKAMGFPDVYYYGVDEPAGERIEVCRKEAERRAKLGFHMFTAINSVAAQEATKDFIDRPVYVLGIFNGPDNPAVMYARKKGFRPISYWSTATSFPLCFRAQAGLYNTRCGYLGTAPWGYQDYPDNRVYDDQRHHHAVSYPDEAGEPIPSLNWEAYRAGVDDVRYLQALRRALAAAEKLKLPPAGLAEALAKGRAAQAARFESINGKLHEYFGFAPDLLDQSRRDMAEATVEIVKRLTK